MTSTEPGAEVNKGELTLESNSVEHGEVYRCKLADQVSSIETIILTCNSPGIPDLNGNV